MKSRAKDSPHGACRSRTPPPQIAHGFGGGKQKQAGGGSRNSPACRSSPRRFRDSPARRSSPRPSRNSQGRDRSPHRRDGVSQGQDRDRRGRREPSSHKTFHLQDPRRDLPKRFGTTHFPSPPRGYSKAQYHRDFRSPSQGRKKKPKRSRKQKDRWAGGANPCVFPCLLGPGGCSSPAYSIVQ